MADLTAFVNGEFLPAKNASISIFDRGLRWGDAIYEVERTFKHTPFRLDNHLERLERSMRYTRIKPDISLDEIGSLIKELVARNSKAISPDSDMEVAQIITRGDLWPNSRPNVIMYCRELDWPTLAKTFKNGTRLATSSTRRVPHQCLSPNAKVSNKMSQFVAEREVKAADPDARPLMLDWQGNVAEEASSNVFFVSKGRLMTPSTQNCLPGISRKVTLELAEKMGLEIFVGAVSPFDAINADEAFLTITSYCMIVVTHLDGGPMNGGAAQPGPLTGRLLEAWKDETGIDFVEQARRMGELKSS